MKGAIFAILFASIAGCNALTAENVEAIKTDLWTLYQSNGKYMGRALRLSKKFNSHVRLGKIEKKLVKHFFFLQSFPRLCQPFMRWLY